MRHSAPPVPKSTRPLSYANVVTRAKGKGPKSDLVIYSGPQYRAKSPATNEWQFLLLHPEATERSLSPYPLLFHLRRIMGENAP
ncbi:hypothetical protein K3495_g4664 [Podosphaera aphanis]|nr:hypothetical protein K3495_g4664 [Podosphaera aphanis]